MTKTSLAKMYKLAKKNRRKKISDDDHREASFLADRFNQRKVTTDDVACQIGESPTSSDPVFVHTELAGDAKGVRIYWTLPAICTPSSNPIFNGKWHPYDKYPSESRDWAADILCHGGWADLSSANNDLTESEKRALDNLAKALLELQRAHNEAEGNDE